MFENRKHTTKRMISNSTKGVIVIEGHIQGLANTRILGKVGIPVIVIDKHNCIARYSVFCKKYYQCPDFISDDFITFLIDLQKIEHIKDWLLLPSNDHAVYNIAMHKTELSKYYKMIIEDSDKINNIYRKRDLLKTALKVDIPIPESIFPEVECPSNDYLRYPIIVKGNEGLSFYKKYNKKAIIINDEFEYKQVMFNQMKHVNPKDYFIQEVIPNDYKTISVTVFCIDGLVKSHWTGVKLREHPIIFGTATCCKSIDDETALEQSKVLIKELNYNGICEIEWLKDSRDNHYKLIEINARTWLWVGLAAKCGVSYPLIVYNHIYKNIVPSQVKYKTNVVWINVYTDLVYSIIGLIKRKTKFRDVVESYKNFTEASWDVIDPLPFFMYGLFSIAFLRRR